MRIFVFIICILSLLNCRIIKSNCPSIMFELKSFDINRYLGKWYEIARMKSFKMESGNCSKAEYSLIDNNNIKVKNTEIRNGITYTAYGVASTTVKESVFSIKFENNKGLGDYRVIDTDYENYSLIYSCGYFGEKMEFVWILSRKPNLDENTLNKLISEINNKFNISKNELHFTDQNCS